MSRKRKRVEENRYHFPASPADVECMICLDIMHEPFRLNCSCERSFCRKCLLKMPGTQIQCPHCKQFSSRDEMMACSRQWRNVLDAIPRRCPNDPTCRHKRANYEDIHRHATTECAYREQICPNEECGQMIKCKNMREHTRLCRAKRCKNFIPPKYGCQEMGTQKEIEAHECKCGVPRDVLNQIRQLLLKKKKK